MKRMLPALVLFFTCAISASGDDSKDKPRKASAIAPSLPFLTQEEEDQLDEVLDRSILADTRKLRGDAAKDRIGNVYVDDQTGTPTFGTLPAFWLAEVSDVKAKA